MELSIEEGRVDIHVEHPEGQRWQCPHCERELSCYDHSPERTWRHLDTCQLETHLHARIPRVQCPEHGVVQVAVPWAEERGRFTLLMERFIIQALLAEGSDAASSNGTPPQPINGFFPLPRR